MLPEPIASKKQKKKKNTIGQPALQHGDCLAWSVARPLLLARSLTPRREERLASSVQTG
jgi:hypothetical protein